jgi:subtilisin family serine protease
VILAEQADLSGAYQIKDWNARGWYVYEQLTSFADASQSDLEALLSRAKVRYTRYWIVNAIYVTSGEDVLKDIARQPEVKEIFAPRTYMIPELESAQEIDRDDAVEWNIDRINAPQVWSTYAITGTGIVVASMDTGVQYNHPALVNHYRGNLGGSVFDHNYNWYDPTNTCSPANIPCDNVWQGTHTMGIMVGDDGAGNQIGVAPGARFIIVKVCRSTGCSEAALLSGAQWVLAPTDLTGANLRPDLRPHVVNNSWGGFGGDTWFQTMVQSWVAAGIFPAFSNGSTGASCYTSNSPADYPESYSAGYFDSNNVIAYYSSRGPSEIGGIIKPNIAAPGVNIRSSAPTDTYSTYSGASFASPHVAATVALMWAANPTLVGDVDGTRAILDSTAIDTSDLQCGGTAANNNVYGQGRLDAFAAVSQAKMSNRIYLPIVTK